MFSKSANRLEFNLRIQHQKTIEELKLKIQKLEREIELLNSYQYYQNDY
jgi:cell division protein FtsB